MQLSRELGDLEVGNANLSENFLHTVKLDHAVACVLLGEQAERILDVGLVELGVGAERENVEELPEVESFLLFKHLLEFLFLLRVRLEANHVENLLQALIVDPLVCVAVPDLAIQVEDLLEVLDVEVGDACRTTFRSLHFSLSFNKKIISL